MRDPARIDRMLETLRTAWTARPDLRLGQLIVVAIQPKQSVPAVFYAEDDLTEAGLEALALIGAAVE